MNDMATVVIATYGDRTHWDKVAVAAIDSVAEQSVPAVLVRVHGQTLAEARNEGARRAKTEWLCFLDADDALDAGYVQQMLDGDGDIRRPSTLGVYPDGTEDDHPVMISRKDLSVANFIVIGAFVRRKLFLSVGGFRDLPCLEDWDLWIRCYLSGAIITDVPEAIYRVGVREGSRNKDQRTHDQVYGMIKGTYREAFRQYVRTQRSSPLS